MAYDAIVALHEHWEQEPPVSLLVAAFVGFKPKKKAKRGELTDAEKERQARELFGMFGGGVIR